MHVTTKKEAEDFLYQAIVDSSTYKHGDFLLKRAKKLLEFLDNPQDKIKVVHIAGTSGKGSTATFIAQLLHSLGAKVGLHIKPHIKDIRERFQINGEMISEEEFVQYVNLVIPQFEKMKKTEYGQSSYIELTVAIAFLIFANKHVDYAVMETGMGGLYDTTNTVTRKDKVAVLTKIGFDHMQFLGNTLPKIAYQKAKIIQNNNMVFSIDQRSSVRNVFDSVAAEEDTSVSYIKKGVNISNIRVSPTKTLFDFYYNDRRLKNLELGMLGSHQVENAGLALAVIFFLIYRDRLRYDESQIRLALQTAHFPARMERVVYKDRTILIDGAHNEQKMKAFIGDLKKMGDKKYNFLIGFKKGKEIKKMIKLIIPVANHIIITDFYTDKQDWTVHSEDPHIVANYLKEYGFSNYEIVLGHENALKKTRGDTIITGSLYLIGEIYPLLVQ